MTRDPQSPGGELHGEEEMVVVLETSDATALPVVRSLLESAGIRCLVRGDDPAGLDTLVRQSAGLLVTPRGIRLLVPASDLELARELLRFEVSEGSDEEDPDERD